MKDFLRLKMGLFILVVIIGACSRPQANQPEWPEISSETKPWTRWWWHGSAVNKEEITKELEALSAAGIGGVEITPIFGVYGFEDQWIEYLSPEWVQVFEHALKEAERLNLGVDMATGTGWPFGGPWIDEEDASKYLAHKTFSLNGGETLKEPVTMSQHPIKRLVGNHIFKEGKRIELAGADRDLKEPLAESKNLQAIAPDQVRFAKPMALQALMAYSASGETIELTDKVDPNGRLDWTAPDGAWTLYAVFQGWHGKMVERAAPGGEGNVIDHFSRTALLNYLKKFDEAFQGTDISSLRAFFNDSYEVDDAFGNADWTPEFFREFEERRGYDLKLHLPALFGADSASYGKRILTDYRQTISDLLLDQFTDGWREWANRKNAIIRNQAHGSPANIIDLYAASDIPETEGREVFMFKLASSAAHLTGKKLVSSEAATWLNEHFLSNWADVKEAVDDYFLGGINHNCYHGTAYSPDDEEWPGWLFYAAVHFNDRNPMWDDFSALNNYIARAQSFLQQGEPDNDILLYYPVFDTYAQRSNSTLHHYHEIERNFKGTSLQETCETLFGKGYAFDFVSDLLLEEVSYSNGSLKTPGGAYRTIVLPQTGNISVATFEKILDLVKEGANLVVHRDLPADFTGYANLEANERKFNALKDQVSLAERAPGIRESRLGKGVIVVSDDIHAALSHLMIRRETLTDLGLKFERRRGDNGAYYFIINKGEESLDRWIPVQTASRAAAIFNPKNGSAGMAKIKSSENQSEVYLQLSPGESCILQTFDRDIEGELYPYYKVAGPEVLFPGPWTITFLEGGPDLPDQVAVENLDSWTELEGDEVKNFSGAAKYSIEFQRPGGNAAAWELDLGKVAETARVRINGQDVGVMIGPEYKIYIDKGVFQSENLLEIEVSNLMANRIAYMDRQGKFWKKFYNVNLPARLPGNREATGLFSAAGWEPATSGLLGPVTLTPVDFLEF